MSEPFREAVLLATPTHFRVLVVTQPVDSVYEREHQPNGSTHERIWYWLGGERAQSGQRVFREILPVAPREPSEAPVYDEMHVKVPLFDRSFNEADVRVKHEIGKPIKKKVTLV